MPATTAPRGLGPPLMASDEILRIARLDAERAYHDLSPYRIAITQEADGWHVDFELKDAAQNGGGPHYVIDAATGTILAKRYEQWCQAMRERDLRATGLVPVVFRAPKPRGQAPWLTIRDSPRHHELCFLHLALGCSAKHHRCGVRS